MAVITYSHEDEEVAVAKAVGGSDEEVLAAVLARKGGPLPFLQAAIDVARKRSDLFHYPSALRKVAAMAAAARAQVEVEVEVEERRRKMKEEARKAAEERRRKEEARSAAAGTKAKLEKKAENTEKAKVKVEEAVKEEEGKRVREPNAENGLDLEKYSWTQQLPDVSVIVPVPQGTKSKFVICEIKKNHLKVGLKGQSPTIDGELYQPVKVVECFWSIDDGESLSIILTKQNQMVWWKSVIKGDPEMDIRKVKPITKLSDLDPETRETIKKAIIDRRRKELGLPTSDEIQKQELLKNLMTQMDFSRENMA